MPNDFETDIEQRTTGPVQFQIVIPVSTTALVRTALACHKSN